MADKKQVHEDAERLTRPDWLKDVDSGQGGRHQSVRAEISNAMVGLMKDFYGKGPTKAKTFLNDNYVFCVMEGGLTRNEETLIERGHEDLVRHPGVDMVSFTGSTRAGRRGWSTCCAKRTQPGM